MLFGKLMLTPDILCWLEQSNNVALDIVLYIGGMLFTGTVPDKLVGTHPRGHIPYETDGDARQKIRIKGLKETNLGVAQAFFDP